MAYNINDDGYGHGYEDDTIAKMHDDMLDAGIIDGSGAFIKTDIEVLDDMDITIIENYLREKKLLKISKKISKKK